LVDTPPCSKSWKIPCGYGVLWMSETRIPLQATAAGRSTDTGEDQVDQEKLAQHHQAQPTRHETNMARSRTCSRQEQMASTCDPMHLWRGLSQRKDVVVDDWPMCLLQILGQNIVAYPHKLVYINEECSATGAAYSAKQSEPQRRHTAEMYASAKRSIPQYHTCADRWWRPLASTKTTYNSTVGRRNCF